MAKAHVKITLPGVTLDIKRAKLTKIAALVLDLWKLDPSASEAAAAIISPRPGTTEKERTAMDLQERYFVAWKRAPKSSIKDLIERVRDGLLDPPSASTVRRATDPVREMIERWRELSPEGNLRELKTLDDLPEPDEPEEPKNFT